MMSKEVMISHGAKIMPPKMPTLPALRMFRSELPSLKENFVSSKGVCCLDELQISSAASVTGRPTIKETW